jgi:hypothetical protein
MSPHSRTAAVLIDTAAALRQSHEAMRLVCRYQAAANGHFHLTAPLNARSSSSRSIPLGHVLAGRIPGLSVTSSPGPRSDEPSHLNLKHHSTDLLSSWDTTPSMETASYKENLSVVASSRLPRHFLGFMDVFGRSCSSKIAHAASRTPPDNFYQDSWRISTGFLLVMLPPAASCPDRL